MRVVATRTYLILWFFALKLGRFHANIWRRFINWLKLWEVPSWSWGCLSLPFNIFKIWWTFSQAKLFFSRIPDTFSTKILTWAWKSFRLFWLLRDNCGPIHMWKPYYGFRPVSSIMIHSWTWSVYFIFFYSMNKISSWAFGQNLARYFKRGVLSMNLISRKRPPFLIHCKVIYFLLIHRQI